jgi:hypothetical protein
MIRSVGLIAGVLFIFSECEKATFDHRNSDET